MKKFLCAVTVIILCSICTVNVCATEPQEPKIESQFPDCYVVVGEHVVTLYSDATSPDGGTLEYQWYSTTVNEIATIRAIDDATGGTYTPPQKVGVVYYCYAVWNVKDGNRSNPVYSRLIRVEYAESNDEPTVDSIEILSTPDKVVYTAGECLDLTGLRVRIWTSDGYMDSVNGEKLEITKDPLVTVGEQKIKVAYGDAFDFFIVTVKEASHTHTFGDWTVTTEPGCTEPGIKTRECDCGYTERAEIPATGHQWDEGQITKEPTEDSEGEKTFTCTVCDATYTETVKAGDTVSEPADDSNPTDNSTGTVSAGESEASGESQPSGTEQFSAFPWWIIVLLIIVIATGIGATVYIVNRKKK